MLNKKLLKFLYFGILDIVHLDKLKLKKIKNDNNIIILNLHKISNEANLFYPSISLCLFEELLIYLSKNFKVITFKELNPKINSDRPILILSFDDGFHDFLENAVPLLKKYKISVNLNVIPECIESGKPVWDVMLGDILNQLPSEKINKIDLPNFSLKLSHSNKAVYGLAITRYLKKMGMKERKELWSVFEKLAKEVKVEFTRMLSKNEINKISKIHEIGVHSFSHESMGLESRCFFEDDFNKCQHYFNNELKLSMKIYAFPSGSYKQYQIDYLLANGIEHVLLVNEEYSKNNTKIHNRFTYYADSKSEVKFRALGFHR